MCGRHYLEIRELENHYEFGTWFQEIIQESSLDNTEAPLHFYIRFYQLCHNRNPYLSPYQIHNLENYKYDTIYEMDNDVLLCHIETLFVLFSNKKNIVKKYIQILFDAKKLNATRLSEKNMLELSIISAQFDIDISGREYYINQILYSIAKDNLYNFDWGKLFAKSKYGVGKIIDSFFPRSRDKKESIDVHVLEKIELLFPKEN